MQENASSSAAAAPDYTPVLAAANTPGRPARTVTSAAADGSVWVELASGDRVHVPAGHMLQPIGAAGFPNVKTESKRRNTIRRFDAWLESGRIGDLPLGRDPRLTQHEFHPTLAVEPGPYSPIAWYPDFGTRCRPARCAADVRDNALERTLEERGLSGEGTAESAAATRRAAYDLAAATPKAHDRGRPPGPQLTGQGRPSSGAHWLARAPPVKAPPARPPRPGNASLGPGDSADRSRSPATMAKAAPEPRGSIANSLRVRWNDVVDAVDDAMTSVDDAMTSVSVMVSVWDPISGTVVVTPERSWRGCGQCKTRGHCQTLCKTHYRTYEWFLNGAPVVETYAIIVDDDFDNLSDPIIFCAPPGLDVSAAAVETNACPPYSAAAEAALSEPQSEPPPAADEHGVAALPPATTTIL
jgi:hypothetical protein